MFRFATMTVFGLALFVGNAQAQDMPKPGPEHDKLKAYEGDWDAVVKMGAGMEMKGTCSFKLEMGGFHLTSTFKGEFEKKPFEGRGTMSYCPVGKKYVSTWIDSMSPSPMVSSGKYDDDKTFSDEGEQVSMTQPNKIVKGKSKTVWADKDNFTTTMWEVGADGKDVQTLSITYTRKK